MMWVVLVATLYSVWGIDNGLGRVPQMGYSSWNDQSSEVNDARMRMIVDHFIEKGLTKLGYQYFNVDEGWLKGRAANGSIISDPVKFPHGMKALGDYIHSKGLKYGLYTSRGTVQCSTRHYHGPGSQGHEKGDAAQFAEWGADYLKEDSCGGTQDHSAAFAQYGLMRDALNMTGRPIFFSLCGWNTWYAPVGATLGNSWRISGDGHSWPALVTAANKMATLTAYANPGGWNDPDLLIGTGQGSYNPATDGWQWGQTDLQSRSQFSLWSVFPAPLLISGDPANVTQYALETWTNAEVIAVNQDPLGAAGVRISGGELNFIPDVMNAEATSWYAAMHDLRRRDAAAWEVRYGVPSVGRTTNVLVAPCDGSVEQQWEAEADGSIRSIATKLCLDQWDCGSTDGTMVDLYPCHLGVPGCDKTSRNQQWTINNTYITSKLNGLCLDVYNTAGPQVDLWTCHGGSNQKWSYTGNTLKSMGNGHCLTSALPQPVNVWAKRLHDGSHALVYVNNGAADVDIPCDKDCFAKLGFTGSVKVRDLWAHKDVGTTEGTFTATNVTGKGGCRMFKMTPA